MLECNISNEAVNFIKGISKINLSRGILLYKFTKEHNEKSYIDTWKMWYDINYCYTPTLCLTTNTHVCNLSLEENLPLPCTNFLNISEAL